MQGALTRYRIIAWIVGVFLLLLVGVTMPLKYIGDNPTPAAIISPIHGLFYMVYLVAVFDLARRLHWRPGRMIQVMLLGTIPFFSFWAERKVTREWVPAAELAKSPV